MLELECFEGFVVHEGPKQPRIYMIKGIPRENGRGKSRGEEEERKLLFTF